MNLEEKLLEEMKEAMKTNDKIRLSTIRMIRSSSKNKEIELRRKLEDEDILKVIQRMVRKGEESIEQFQAGGRNDLVEKEKREMEILKSFLPQPIRREEIIKIINETIQETQASSLKDLAISPLGQKRCLALTPTRDRFLIESRLTEVIELKEILETLGDIPLRGLKDIGELLKRLEVAGSVLEVQEILDIHRQMLLGKGLRRFFLKPEGKAPSPQAKISKLSALKALEKEILQAINTKGEVLD